MSAFGSKVSKLPQVGMKRTQDAASKPEVEKKARLDTARPKLRRSVSHSNLFVPKSNVVGTGLKRTPSSTNLCAPGTVYRPAAATATRNPLPSALATRGKVLSQRQVSGNAVSAPTPQIPGGAKKKPAPWDLKGQMEVLKTTVAKDKENMQSLISRIELLEKDKQQAVSGVEVKSKELDSVKVEASQYLQKSQVLEDQNRSLQAKLRDAEQRISELSDDTSLLRAEKSALQDELREYKSANSVFKTKISTHEMRIESLECELSSVQKKWADSQERVEALRAANAELDEKMQAGESIRKKLHNTVQELKGNIRVFCRVRPFIPGEKEGKAMFAFPGIDQKDVDIMKFDPSGADKKPEITKFSFDKSFPPNSSQATVFTELSELVQSVLDGYNVCVFAYGQTGSGKTYTMEGITDMDEPERHAGIIPRAVVQIFKTVKSMEKDGWTYKIEASFLEIYNENLRDLLATSKKSAAAPDVRVIGKTVEVIGLNVVEVTDSDQIFSLLDKARKNRAVAATKCNEQSSRSHSVFRLKLTGTNDKTQQTSLGELNLVDLAGNERLKDSGSEGDRLVETKNINKSLSALSRVILSLANKESHIPYRSSKLSTLLMNSMGGRSKMLMIVTVSPKEDYYNESINSLRFATSVNHCNIGTAQQSKGAVNK